MPSIQRRQNTRTARASAGLYATSVAALATVGRRFNLDRQLDFWMSELDPAWSLTELRARVVRVEDETADVKTFVLAPNSLWRGHRAGQFVTVSIEVNGVVLTRCYSVASPPGELPGRHLAITVKRVPGGRVSNWMHEHLRRGDVVRLGAPAGDFVVHARLPAKLLLLSGGSGVTPVMSILRDLARRNAVSDVVFLHAARSRNDAIFFEEIQQLARQHSGLRLAFVFERRSPDDVADETIHFGRIDAGRLAALVPDFAARKTFLCGPTPMMDALSNAWSDPAIAYRLKTERFNQVARAVATAANAPASSDHGPTAATSARGFALTLLRSGRTLHAGHAGTVLEQLERAGESPPNGCRMGICNTCRCRKQSGVVQNVVTGEVSNAADEDIRLCVSRAQSNLELSL